MYEGKGIADEMGLEREYYLKCRVHVKRIQGRKGKDDSQTFESFHTILEPLESDHRNHFYSAWLPLSDHDPETCFQEVLGTVSYPYNFKKARLSLGFPNKLFSSIHLVVMDEGASEMLSKHADGKTISVMIHPQRDELRDYGLDYD